MDSPVPDILYILDGKIAQRCTDLMQWGMFMQDTSRRQVAVTHVEGASISTVFLGVDYSVIGSSDPLLFETLVFYGNGKLGSMLRYFTWVEAEAGHEDVVEATRIEVERAKEMTASVLDRVRARLRAGEA